MIEQNIDNPSPLSISKKRVEQISSILWMVLGAVVIYQTKGLDYTDDFGPAAGFFPLWLGIILIFLGILLAFQTFDKKKKKQEINISSKKTGLKMFLIICGLLFFVSLIEKAGFYLSSSLLFLFLLYVVERHSFKYSLFVAVLSFFTLWLIFGLGLKLQLPTGFMTFLKFIR